MDTIIVTEENPVYALKEWYVLLQDGQYKLHGRWASAVWMPGEPLETVCERGESHQPPFMSCSCGIYGNKLNYTHPGGHLLYGTIKLWGQIIIDGGQYRGQFAYPTHFDSIQNCYLFKSTPMEYLAFGFDMIPTKDIIKSLVSTYLPSDL